jgi:hypothetical protein
MITVADPDLTFATKQQPKPAATWRRGIGARSTIQGGRCSRFRRGCSQHSLGATRPPSYLNLSREPAKLWIEENQLGRRNLSDDQKAMVAEGARERRAHLSRREQLARARDVKAGRSVEDCM